MAFDDISYNNDDMSFEDMANNDVSFDNVS